MALRRLAATLGLGYSRVPVLHGAAWSVADHVIISASNFLTVVLVARATGPAGLGVFALAYSAMQLANGVQAALLTQPHNVLGASRTPADGYVRYNAGALSLQILVALVLAAIALVVALVMAASGVRAAAVVAALSAAIAANQLQEFARRAMYTEDRLAAAVLNDSIGYGGQVAIVGVLSLAVVLTPETAILAIAASSGVAVLAALIQLRPRPALRHVGHALRLNWRFGGWLLGGVGASWLSTETYLYFVAGILGAASAGAFKAADVVLRPLNVIFVVLETFLLVRLSRRLASGKLLQLRSDVRTLQLLLAPLVVTYCLFAALFGGRILVVVYGAQYESFGYVVGLMACVYLVRFTGLVISIAIRALQVTWPLFLGPLSAAGATLAFGWLLTARLGLAGAVLGLMLSAFISNIPRWTAYAAALSRGSHSFG